MGVYYVAVTTQNIAEQTPAFSVKEFAPGWGASVMGTGVISALFSALERTGIVPEISGVLAQIFMIIAILIALPVVGITTARWVRFPGAVQSDLKNPVKGAMFATFAGAFLVLAVTFSRAGTTLFGTEVATVLTHLFTAVGALLALLIGWWFLTDIFARGDVAPPMITGAWFIPPVVTIIVPTALAPTFQTPGAAGKELFWLSWIFLGIGTLLYLVVVAALFVRSATHPAPPAPLAPTLVIGMGPAGLIALDTALLAEAGIRLGVMPPEFLGAASAIAVMLWGFGLWWGIAAVLVIRRAHPHLQYALSWWGFIFPLGAWTVAGIITGALVGSSIITWISLLGAVILLAVWLIVLVKTWGAIRNRSIWTH